MILKHKELILWSGNAFCVSVYNGMSVDVFEYRVMFFDSSDQILFYKYLMSFYEWLGFTINITFGYIFEYHLNVSWLILIIK